MTPTQSTTLAEACAPPTVSRVMVLELVPPALGPSWKATRCTGTVTGCLNRPYHSHHRERGREERIGKDCSSFPFRQRKRNFHCWTRTRKNQKFHPVTSFSGPTLAHKASMEELRESGVLR